MYGLQSSRLRKFSLVASAVLSIAASVLTAPGAFAATPEDKISMRFEFERSAPASVTYHRLAQAAWRTCRYGGMVSFGAQRIVATCARTMIDDGVAKIGSPDLATLHALSTGKPLPSYAEARQPG